MLTNCLFDSTKNKLHCYKGEDWLKRFSYDLKKHALKIINYEKKETIPLTNEENKYYEMQKVYALKNLILMMVMMMMMTIYKVS